MNAFISTIEKNNAFIYIIQKKKTFISVTNCVRPFISLVQSANLQEGVRLVFLCCFILPANFASYNVIQSKIVIWSTISNR